MNYCQTSPDFKSFSANYLFNQLVNQAQILAHKIATKKDIRLLQQNCIALSVAVIGN